MLRWFKDLFSESSDVSMTRFLSFLCVSSAIIVAFTAVIRASDLSDATMLCSAFLAAGFTGKVMQRSIESREFTESAKQKPFSPIRKKDK